MATLDSLYNILRSADCSCVICNGDRVEYFHQRGISDLYEVLHTDKALLSGAMVADKVVGKGAMALMIAGGVEALVTDVVSASALDLGERYGIRIEYKTLVPHIINRQGDGICPVESLCQECQSVEECLAQIDIFINKTTKN